MRYLRLALILLIPALCLEAATRVAVRGPMKGSSSLLDYLGPVRERSTPPDVLFVGSSRVGAAVQLPEVNKALTEGDASLAMIRVARGLSTSVIQTLAFRRLLEADPTALQGTRVLVEAPTGLAEPRMWTDGWARDEWPELLGAQLRPREWPGLVCSSTSLNSGVTALVSSGSAVARYWSTFRQKARQIPGHIVEPAMKRATNAALIRGEALAGDRSHAEHAALATREMEGQTVSARTTPTEWRQTALATLVDELRAAGAHPMFFAMPLSQHQQGISGRQPRLEADRRAFEAWLIAEDIPLLSPPFTCEGPDVDCFPDLSHMARPEAERFSAALGLALRPYLESRP